VLSIAKPLFDAALCTLLNSRYYFQLVATDVLGAHGFFGIIQQFGWRKVRLVAQDGNIFTATMDILRDMLDKNAVEYTEIQFRSDETVASINAFDSETRICVGNVQSSCKGCTL
jgi:hypothetical protein